MKFLSASSIFISKLEAGIKFRETLSSTINNIQRRIADLHNKFRFDESDFQKATPEISDSDGENEILNKLMKIDFVQKKDSVTDIITIKCKIKHLIILGAVVNPNANFAIMTDNITKQLNLRIDTSERHNLKDITTVPIELLDIIRNMPIYFAPRCIILRILKNVNKDHYPYIHKLLFYCLEFLFFVANHQYYLFTFTHFHQNITHR